MKRFKKTITAIIISIIAVSSACGQHIIYIQHNDSLVEHISDSIARTKPINEKNAYKIAIGQLFDTYWGSKTKAKLPLAEVMKKKKKIEQLQKQSADLSGKLEISRDSVYRSDSTIFIKNKVLDSLTMEVVSKQSCRVDSSSIKRLASDTLRLSSEIALIRQKIEEKMSQNEEMEDSNASLISSIEKEQDNIGVKLLLFSSDVNKAYKMSTHNLISVDTLMLQRVCEEYQSYGSSFFTDSVSLNSKVESISYVLGVATLLQRSIIYMADSNYEKVKSDIMIEAIKQKEKSKNLSVSQKKECADIRSSLDFQEVAYLNLQYIIDEIWKKYPNGFLSSEELEGSQIIKKMIDPEVKLATDGELAYNVYYVKMNKALEHIRDLFNSENYVRNKKYLKDKAGMTTLKSKIQKTYGL